MQKNSKNRVKLSIITINFNNFNGLDKTIKSVVSQNSNDFEYIIIDGGSTDGSAEVIKQYESQIAYWVSEHDRGIYHAMNKGVSKANGEYCIFMNSGDCLYDSSVVSRFVEANFVEDIIVGKVFANTDMGQLSLPPVREISMYHLYSGAIPHQGAFIRRKLLQDTPYDESLRISSDWKFFLQTIIFKNCSFKYIEDNIAIYDTSGLSFSNPEPMRREKEQVMRDLLPPRILADYEWMKASECLTSTLTPQLRRKYKIDKFLYRIGRILLNLSKK